MQDQVYVVLVYCYKCFGHNKRIGRFKFSPALLDYYNISINSGTVIFCINAPVHVSPNNIPIVNETVLESIPSFNRYCIISFIPTRLSLAFSFKNIYAF